MTFLGILYTLFIAPIRLLFEVIFSCANRITENPGLTIISLSLSMNFLILPLYMRADALQEEEKNIEMKLAAGVAHIKKTFKGDERMMMLQTYYRQNGYKPTYVLRGAMSLFLEIPFFIAAYRFLSELPMIRGVSFGPIADLGNPDGLLVIGGIAINILPILMTVINAISTAIFTKGYPKKTKLQLYAMALFFLVFLYDSPAGLVFYWTLNNLFSLVKTIFYKLKNPKRILSIMASVVGIGSIVLGLRYVGISVNRVAVFVGLGIALQLPWILKVLNNVKQRHGRKCAKAEQNAGRNPYSSNGKFFILSASLLTILTGIVIPSSVIKSSPLEFVSFSVYLHPTWYIVYTLCVAAGTFLVWFQVFYRLSNEKTKCIIEKAACILCLIALIDYLFFAGSYGTLSDSLIYEQQMIISSKTMLANLCILALAGIALLPVMRYTKKLLPELMLVCVLAFGVMSVANIYNINKDIKIARSKITDGGIPQIHMSTKGKNVVVIMLDRALGEYIPYVMTEKPELKEKYAGFTYYPNTISYGGHTNFASPALFGGYEYTPKKLNERPDEPLVEKQNESLKVMPVLFDENGYDVTVFDPVYAGYQWIPDLTIYDEYPEIKAFNTTEFYTSEDQYLTRIYVRNRNFFCYAFMKIMPSCIQGTLYDNGNYQNLSDEIDDGINDSFQQAFCVLQNMNNMTVIHEDDSDHFLMMSNDTTHSEVFLQMPDYTMSSNIDNSAYPVEDLSADKEFGKFSEMKLELTAENEEVALYQCQMAAYLELAKWFDYLREHDLYDNTRIILVSDHGYGIQRCHQLPNMVLQNGDTTIDTEFYRPLLMVKDFGASEFTVSEEFMTNADTPQLAVQDLIERPMNPFTNKVLDGADKNAGIQYIIDSELWRTWENDGNVFKPAIWLAVDTSDVWNINNWQINAQNAAMPKEE